jgi:DNA-binding XRE family transcriptional regulator
MTATTLKQMLDRLPVDRRRKINARADELIAEEMSLRDLRKAHDLTQERMAEMLNIGQDSVSRLEQRSDLLLSTLRGYVAAMGGSLELVARFPDRPCVILSGLAELGTGSNTTKPKVGKSGARDRKPRARR